VPLIWQAVGLRSDPQEAEHLGDPGDLLAAFVADLLHRPAWGAACRGAGAARWFPGRMAREEPSHRVAASAAHYRSAPATPSRV